jgi:hypothetical protein
MEVSCGGLLEVLLGDELGVKSGIKAGDDSANANEVESKNNNGMLVGY